MDDGERVIAFIVIAIIFVSSIAFGLIENDKAYDSGYESGYEKGYNAGYDEGRYDGYEKGHDDGYDEGYKEALEETEIGLGDAGAYDVMKILLKDYADNPEVFDMLDSIDYYLNNHFD
jgi:hypothetical protein